MTDFLTSLVRDLRYSLRSLRRQPGLTLVVVLTLAVGIGANTAIFSFLVESFYWEYNAPEPDHLFFVLSGPEATPQWGVSYADALSYHDTLGDLGELGTWAGYGAVVRLPRDGSGDGMAAYRVGRGVSPKTFELFGVGTVHGRLFSDDEMRPGAPYVTVLQNYFWRRYLGGDPEIVGRTIDVNGIPFTVIGVLEEKSYEFSLSSGSIYTPLHQLDDITKRGQLSDPTFRYFNTLVRLDDADRRPEAEARLAVLAGTLDEERPWGGGVQRNIGLRGVEERVEGPTTRTVLLLGSVGALLLLACANVANLLLARAAGRQREIAVMTAVGAGRGRIASRLLVESVLLSLVGGLLGLAVAWSLTLYMFDILTTMPLGLSSWGEGQEVPGYDDRVLLFTLLISCLTGGLFGLAPVLFAARTDLVSALKTGRGDVRAGRRVGARQVLVVGQVLISTVLLLGAGLLVRSMAELQSRDQGFEAEKMLLAVVATAPPDVDPVSAEGEDAAAKQRATQLRLYDLARQRIEEIPGVRSAALLFQPLAAGWVYQDVVEIPGQADDGVTTDTIRVGPGTFETYGIEIQSGRGFNDSDVEGGVGAVVVNRTFAERYWPDSEPLGREVRVRKYADRVEGGRFVIVGVAEDVRHGSRRDAVVPLVYLPLGQALVGSRMTVAARAAGAPEVLTAQVRSALAGVHPDLALSEIGTYDRLTAVDLYAERLFSRVAALLGIFGLAIASLGIYSVMSCSVSYRVREIGIRVAVGASGRDVLRLVLGEALGLVVAGVLLGVAAALGLGRLLASQLHGVSAADPQTFVVLPLVLALIGVVASWLPAWRATRLDPKSALVQE